MEVLEDEVNKTIWKYRIGVCSDYAEPFEMPEGSNVVRVGMQGILICLWVCVLPEAPTEKRSFYFTGTGHPVPLKDCYVGSCSDREFEWHVWEKSK